MCAANSVSIRPLRPSQPPARFRALVFGLDLARRFDHDSPRVEIDAPRDGRFVEKIGTFDPLKAKDDASRLVLDQEKAKAWLAKGAQPTDRVLRLLDGLGLAKRPARNNPQKAQPKKKAQERAAAAAAAAAKAAEAPAA